MKNNIIRLLSILAIPILLLLYFTFLKTDRGDPFDPSQKMPGSPPRRIISFAPSITEILYELGVGDNVMGVTQFCTYPPEAASKDKIGGHVDHNYEAILRLKPDFAVVFKERADIMRFLDKHSIRYVAVGSESIDEIIEAVQLISAACFASEKGDSLAQSLRGQLEEASAAAEYNMRRYYLEDESQRVKLLPPRVLFCVGRDDIGSGTITKVFAAGPESFYSRLIKAAGGINVINETGQAYPPVSTEAIIRLDPDIIIDIAASYLRPTPEMICRDWKSLKSVKAVNTDRVHCLSGDYVTIPGPRFGLILEDLERIFKLRAEVASRKQQ